MKVIKSIEELEASLESTTYHGCIADTGFLYAIAYEDDRLFHVANDILDLLGRKNIPIFINVISRMEFIDLIFRKQITIGAIQTLESIKINSIHKNLLNLLRNIRDQNTAHRSKMMSYKVDEARLKRLRTELEGTSPITWKAFCQLYTDKKLVNEWKIVEEDLGLNFIEILEGQMSEHFNSPLLWEDMVKTMGEQGLRGPDAMIANLFDKSKFPLMITSDSDFEKCFNDPLREHSNKTIFLL